MLLRALVSLVQSDSLVLTVKYLFFMNDEASLKHWHCIAKSSQPAERKTMKCVNISCFWIGYLCTSGTGKTWHKPERGSPFVPWLPESWENSCSIWLGSIIQLGNYNGPEALFYQTVISMLWVGSSRLFTSSINTLLANLTFSAIAFFFNGAILVS